MTDHGEKAVRTKSNTRYELLGVKNPLGTELVVRHLR